MRQKYHLNTLGSKGFVGSEAARTPPILPHLLGRYNKSSLRKQDKYGNNID